MNSYTYVQLFATRVGNVHFYRVDKKNTCM
jgi:hypothetical protein